MKMVLEGGLHRSRTRYTTSATSPKRCSHTPRSYGYAVDWSQSRRCRWAIAILTSTTPWRSGLTSKRAVSYSAYIRPLSSMNNAPSVCVMLLSAIQQFLDNRSHSIHSHLHYSVRAIRYSCHQRQWVMISRFLLVLPPLELLYYYWVEHLVRYSTEQCLLGRSISKYLGLRSSWFTRSRWFKAFKEIDGQG